MEKQIGLTVQVDNSEELKKLVAEIHEHLDCAMKKYRKTIRSLRWARK